MVFRQLFIPPCIAPQWFQQWNIQLLDLWQAWSVIWLLSICSPQNILSKIYGGDGFMVINIQGTGSNKNAKRSKGMPSRCKNVAKSRQIKKKKIEIQTFVLVQPKQKTTTAQRSNAPSQINSVFAFLELHVLNCADAPRIRHMIFLLFSFLFANQSKKLWLSCYYYYYYSLMFDVRVYLFSQIECIHLSSHIDRTDWDSVANWFNKPLNE